VALLLPELTLLPPPGERPVVGVLATAPWLADALMLVVPGTLPEAGVLPVPPALAGELTLPALGPDTLPAPVLLVVPWALGVPEMKKPLALLAS
jgi:hypothetical protein